MYETHALSRGASTASWIAQLGAAGVLAQTLFFKFTAAEESVYIFRTLGVEPWGRIATGVLELVAVTLLMWPRRAAWGALLAAGVMGGAMALHLTVLGITVRDDGGLLFGLNITVLVLALAVAFLRRRDLPRFVFGHDIVSALVRFRTH